jgi:hypothetical protein
MNQPLEDSVAATYRARASTVRDAPGLAERAIARGRRVRRQRRAYSGLAVVAAVALTVGTPALLGERDGSRSPASPVSTPSGQPASPAPPTSVPKDAFTRTWDSLPVGAPTNVPFAIGPGIFSGSERITLPTKDSPIGEVQDIGSDYLVYNRRFGSRPGTVGLVSDDGSYRRLDKGVGGGFVLDSRAERAAWVSWHVRSEPVRTTLTVVSLPDGKESARRVVDGVWDAVGFSENGLVLESNTFFVQSQPSSWDPATGVVTEIPLPWPSPPGGAVEVQAGGGLLLFGGLPPGYVLTSRPQDLLWEQCDVDFWRTAVSPGGALVAAVDFPTENVAPPAVLDAATGEVVQRWRMPPDVKVFDVAWEDPESVIFAISESYDGYPLWSTLIRCRVGEETRERVPTPGGGLITALGGK